MAHEISRAATLSTTTVRQNADCTRQIASGGNMSGGYGRAALLIWPDPICLLTEVINLLMARWPSGPAANFTNLEADLFHSVVKGIIHIGAIIVMVPLPSPHFHHIIAITSFHYVIAIVSLLTASKFRQCKILYFGGYAQSCISPPQVIKSSHLLKGTDRYSSHLLCAN